ncbi:MAG: hypothetical protein Sylvanvirus11_28 [Sylvanvirus sp.]|uniref:Uncharacterized protein n=1 Tax=Sylvanvirus sp. TaxID=2487774 RepID=A0A3G5AI24_9VIRU|nr:MAG: hypothetical protein Sylvanvirus11_28 [Sylvanvirus sp.]
MSRKSSLSNYDLPQGISRVRVNYKRQEDMSWARTILQLSVMPLGIALWNYVAVLHANTFGVRRSGQSLKDRYELLFNQYSRTRGAPNGDRDNDPLRDLIFEIEKKMDLFHVATIRGDVNPTSVVAAARRANTHDVVLSDDDDVGNDIEFKQEERNPNVSSSSSSTRYATPPSSCSSSSHYTTPPSSCSSSSHHTTPPSSSSSCSHHTTPPSSSSSSSHYVIPPSSSASHYTTPQSSSSSSDYTTPQSSSSSSDYTTPPSKGRKRVTSDTEMDLENGVEILKRQGIKNDGLPARMVTTFSRSAALVDEYKKTDDLRHQEIMVLMNSFVHEQVAIKGFLSKIHDVLLEAKNLGSGSSSSSSTRGGGSSGGSSNISITTSSMDTIECSSGEPPFSPSLLNTSSSFDDNARAPKKSVSDNP